MAQDNYLFEQDTIFSQANSFCTKMERYYAFMADKQIEKAEEVINGIISEIGVMLFLYANYFNVNLTAPDLEYIKNTICRDKCFCYIEQAERESRSEDTLKRKYASMNIIVFYEEFYNSPSCPPATKTLLFGILGLHYDHLQGTSLKIFSTRYPHIQSWLEDIRTK